jgi:hypothetical protein
MVKGGWSRNNYEVLHILHFILKLQLCVQLFLFPITGLRGRKAMKEESLKTRIRQGCICREDVVRRMAELAFGKANDCVRLALEDAPPLDKLDLSLLAEVKRNEKGTVEIKLIDRLRALEQLSQAAGQEDGDMESFLQALQGAQDGV